MKAVYLRELKSYFAGFLGFLFIAAMLLITGVYAYVMNFVQKYPTFGTTLYSVTFAYLIFIPMLTMRTFAQERNLKTIDLLYSLPLTPAQIVGGKYLALLTVLAIPCAVMCVYPLIMSFFGHVELLTSFSSLLGFFLLGAALAAIGMFLSSLTSNQIGAAILIFIAVFFSFLAGDIAGFIPSTAYASFTALLITVLILALCVYFMTKNGVFAAALAIVLEIVLTVFYFANNALFAGLFPRIFRALAVFSRFDPFVSGLFDVGSVVYFITVSALFLFFCILSLERRRWN